MLHIHAPTHTHSDTHTHTHTRQIHRTCLSQYLAHNLVKINSHFCNPASRQTDRENGRNNIASFDIYTCSMNTSDCSSTNSYWMQGKADVSPPGCATSHKIGCHGNVPRGIETLISDWSPKPQFYKPRKFGTDRSGRFWDNQSERNRWR